MSTTPPRLHPAPVLTLVPAPLPPLRSQSETSFCSPPPWSSPPPSIFIEAGRLGASEQGPTRNPNPGPR